MRPVDVMARTVLSRVGAITSTGHIRPVDVMAVTVCTYLYIFFRLNVKTSTYIGRITSASIPVLASRCNSVTCSHMQIIFGNLSEKERGNAGKR